MLYFVFARFYMTVKNIHMLYKFIATGATESFKECVNIIHIADVVVVTNKLTIFSTFSC